MKNIYTKIAIGTITTLPLFTFAAGKTLKNIADLIVEYLNIGLSLIIGLAVVTFVWNIYLYFFTEKDKTEAGKYVMYSVIGFFVILSFWGIVAVVRESLKLDDRQPDTTLLGQTLFNTPGGATTPKSQFLPGGANPTDKLPGGGN